MFTMTTNLAVFLLLETSQNMVKNDYTFKNNKKN